MKQQLYKIAILLTIILSLGSCIEVDEEVISTQDLLIGNWKIVEMKVNGVAHVLTQCELKETLEINTTDVIFVYYSFDDNTSSCILNEELLFPYTFIEDNLFRIYKNDISVDTEIIELNTTSLVLKSAINGVVKIQTYRKIN